MTTAQTPQPQIRTTADHQPTLIAAGVGLFHGENIAYLNIHTFLPEYAANGDHRVNKKGVMP